MTRSELAHILRAAARIAHDPDIVVIGSQAILGSFSERLLPDEATRSIEADIAFRSDPNEDKSDLVDVMIGQESDFHQSFGVYGQGVSLTTAVLPDGWHERVVAFPDGAASPARAACLDPHDLVVAKLVAGRQKDFEFTAALLRANLVRPTILLERSALLPVPVRERVVSTIRRLAAHTRR